MGWLGAKRYRLLARWLGIPIHRPDTRKIIIIQVDALGYDNLQKALSLGYLPHLSRLINSHHYTLERWRPGVPSDTPPVQSGIMYGYSDDLVGFYWLDKKTGRRLNWANPLHAKELEKQIALAAGPGLLTGGASYVNMITGNARRSVFTVSSLDSYRLSNGFGLGKAFIFMLLNPLFPLFTLGHMCIDGISELGDRLWSILRGKPRRREGWFPITRVIINALFREVATKGAILDMVCGTPIIYASYLGYDVVAHHSGPLSRNALRTLRGIDRCLAKIDGVRRWCPHDYELFVLSDHGMTPSIPFAHAYHQPLSEFIASIMDGTVAVEEYDADRYIGQDQLSALGRDLREMEEHLPKPLVALMRKIRSWKRGDPSSPGAETITVIDCSPLAHIYVNTLPRRLDLDEVEKAYPRLIPSLVAHEGIGMVLGKQGGQAIGLSKKGKIVFGRDTQVEGENPLHQFGEPSLAEEEVKRYALMPHGGDVILFGALRDGQLICFQTQLGGHGSLGGDQSFPFLLHPSSIPFPPANKATDLYAFFREIRRNLEGEGHPPAER
ncbi:MAG: alkaline phosphatase family protein [Chloroflexi bacterium]|nr:alkaline phosphatase family protein [Chloroflexota bacterium]